MRHETTDLFGLLGGGTCCPGGCTFTSCSWLTRRSSDMCRISKRVSRLRVRVLLVCWEVLLAMKLFVVNTTTPSRVFHHLCAMGGLLTRPKSEGKGGQRKCGASGGSDYIAARKRPSGSRGVECKTFHYSIIAITPDHAASVNCAGSKVSLHD